MLFKYVCGLGIICLATFHQDRRLLMSDPDKEFLSAEEMMFKSDCKPIENIYVDLEYLQDLKLGTIINTITVKEELAYIVHNLDGYNDRYDRDTGKYFKALHVDEQRITNDLKNDKLINKICVISPFTSIYYHLYEIITVAKNHIKAFSERPRPVTLTINCADVKYPEPLQKILVTTLERNLDIKVDFLSVARYSLASNEYRNFDLLMLYDCGEFIRQHATSFISNGDFVETKIVAQPYVEDAILKNTDNPEYLLSVTEKNIDIYCDFSYLRALIVRDKLTENRYGDE